MMIKIFNKKNKDSKKFNFNLFWIFGIFLIPLFSLSFIFAPAKGGNLVNYFTTYDNALDMSLALGIAPDYDTTSSDSKVKYSNYLEKYVNNTLTQYKNIGIMDGKEVNRNGISQLETNTIVLNEWMKADAYKFEGVINDIAYVSMGDSDEAEYHDDVIPTQGIWKYMSSVSSPNAFLMLGKDLDKIYPNTSIGNFFYNQAKKIIDLQIKRIESIQNQNILSNITHGKTLGFVYTRANASSQILSSSLSVYAPSVYPFLYSKKIGRGLGFEFPAARDSGFENNTHYKKHDIRADSASNLIEQFKNKFDYLVIMKSDSSNLTYSDAISSDISSLLKKPPILDQNVKFGTLGDWYTNAWGIIGIYDLLNKFVDWFSLKQDLSTIWEPYSPNLLRNIRVGKVW